MKNIIFVSVVSIVFFVVLNVVLSETENGRNETVNIGEQPIKLFTPDIEIIPKRYYQIEQSHICGKVLEFQLEHKNGERTVYTMMMEKWLKESHITFQLDEDFEHAIEMTFNPEFEGYVDKIEQMLRKDKMMGGFIRTENYYIIKGISNDFMIIDQRYNTDIIITLNEKMKQVFQKEFERCLIE
jgi:hypothetical protein